MFTYIQIMNRAKYQLEAGDFPNPPEISLVMDIFKIFKLPFFFLLMEVKMGSEF